MSSSVNLRYRLGFGCECLNCEALSRRFSRRHNTRTRSPKKFSPIRASSRRCTRWGFTRTKSRPMPNVSRCRHGMAICPQCIEISDAAKRMSDIINGLVTFTPLWELRSKWIAVRLNDGGYDGNLYDSREDAIRHQRDERFCSYVAMQSMIQGAKPLDCAIYLEVHRQAYDADMRLHEPQAPQLIMPTGVYDSMTGR